MKHDVVCIQINGKWRKVCRLPWDKNHPDAVVFTVGKYILAFGTLDNSAYCTCGCRAFGKCVHARALRRLTAMLRLAIT